MNFTNNPYEKMMKQKPRPLAPSCLLYTSPSPRD